jgi:phage shock protein A
MKAVSQLWLHVQAAIRAILSDLFGEDGSPGQVSSGLSGLEEIQAGLDSLLPELTGLTGRQKQLEAEWRRALEDLNALDARIDTALRQGEDEQAHVLLNRRADQVSRVQELEGCHAELRQSVASSRSAYTTLSERLAEMRRQAASLAIREQNAASLEDLTRRQGTLGRDLEKLCDRLARRNEQAAKAEDRAAALQELRRGADSGPERR